MTIYISLNPFLIFIHRLVGFTLLYLKCSMFSYTFMFCSFHVGFYTFFSAAAITLTFFSLSPSTGARCLLQSSAAPPLSSWLGNLWDRNLYCFWIWGLELPGCGVFRPLNQLQTRERGEPDRREERGAKKGHPFFFHPAPTPAAFRKDSESGWRNRSHRL